MSLGSPFVLLNVMTLFITVVCSVCIFSSLIMLIFDYDSLNCAVWMENNLFIYLITILEL